MSYVRYVELATEIEMRIIKQRFLGYLDRYIVELVNNGHPMDQLKSPLCTDDRFKVSIYTFCNNATNQSNIPYANINH